jgi:hypothetical protein
MRAVTVNENARVVVVIVGIACDVRALVYDKNLLSMPHASRSANTLPA